MARYAKGKVVPTGKHARRNENVQRRRAASCETDPYMARQQRLLQLDLEEYQLLYGKPVKVIL
jgi:hypothetical protein